MADDADKAGDHVEKTEIANIAAIREKAANIPVGKPGECEYCGYEFERLVGGACGRCRDEFKIGV